MLSVKTKLAAATLAGALAIGLAGPSTAAPLPTSIATIKAAAPDAVIDVRWRGRHHGGAIFAGVAAGLIGAAAFGAFSPAYGYYDHGYYPATYAYETYPAYGYYPAYHYYPAYQPYAYYGGPRVYHRHHVHRRHHVRHHHVRHVRHHRHHW